MLTVRAATEDDIQDIANLVDGFVAGHPAESHSRPLSRLREAYFGTHPVAHLLVAGKSGRIVGMCQWTRIYDMFWSAFGGEVGWLNAPPAPIRPGHRARLQRENAALPRRSWRRRCAPPAWRLRRFPRRAPRAVR